MATRIDFDPLFTFRFHARFWKGYAPQGEPIDLSDRGFKSMEVGAVHCGLRQTPLGLEVWTAHRIEKPMLIDLLREAKTVEVVMFAPSADQKSRVFVMNIDKPKCLPFRLNAMSESVGMDGILFQETDLLYVKDEFREWPPNEAKPKEKEVLPGVSEEDRIKLLAHSWFYSGNKWYRDGDPAGYTTEDALVIVGTQVAED